MWSRLLFSLRTVTSRSCLSKSSLSDFEVGFVENFRCNIRFLHQGCLENEGDDETLGSDNSSLARPERKILKVALIGRPNAGKSTLINQIVGRSSCPVSMKAHTTRVKLKAFVNDGATQFVFLDTPGLVFAEEVKRFKFDPLFLKSAEEAVHEADILGIVYDTSLPLKLLDPCTVRLLLMYQEKKSFLILNKVDAAKNKASLLKLADSLTKKPKQLIPDSNTVLEQAVSKETKIISSWPYFTDIFMVSALTGDGVGDIKEFLLQKAYPGRWIVTQNKIGRHHSMAVDFVKAACLDYLPDEVPHKLNFKLLYFEDDGERCAVEVAVTPANKRHQRMLLNSIRFIASYAESHLASCIERECRLRVRVVVEEEPA